MVGTLFSSAAIFGVVTAALASAWGKIRMLLMRAWSLIFVTAVVNGSVTRAIKAHCWANFRRSPFGSKRFLGDRMWVRPNRRQQQVVYEALGNDPIMFWKGWRPFLMGASSTGDSSPNNVNDGAATITFIRGTFDLDAFLLEAVDRYNDTFGARTSDEKSHRRFFIRRFVGAGGRMKGGDNGGVGGGVAPSPADLSTSLDTGEYRILRWNRDQLGPEINEKAKALDALSLPDEVLEAIEEAKHWLVAEKWYTDRQIPWTLGWNIYGPPGTGKSSLIRATGEDLDLPIFIFDLASMSNKEFQNYWNEMKNNAPCIAAFEDVDGVFKGRKNVTGDMGGGLTFDCYINALSGIEGANGILKIQTTNHIEELDEALGVPRKDGKGSTRPGRSDRVIELKDLDDNGRRKIATRILSCCMEYVDQVIAEGQNESGVQFTDRCKVLALQEYWKGLKGKKCETDLSNIHKVTVYKQTWNDMVAESWGKSSGEKTAMPRHFDYST
jgi:hypothetical protein